MMETVRLKRKEGVSMITAGQLEHWFTYHKPTPEQVESYARLREAAKMFAAVVIVETPPCPDQTAAIRGR